MSELENSSEIPFKSARPTEVVPNTEQLEAIVNADHAMALASNEARSDAARSRARMEANPGTQLAATEAHLNQALDSLGARQETAIQRGTTPESYRQKDYRERAKALGRSAFLDQRLDKIA